MGKPTSSIKRILAVYSLEEVSHREHFSGMLRYCENRPNWRIDLRVPTTDSDRREVELGRYDGIILTLPLPEAVMGDLARSDIPTVLVNIDHRAALARTRNIAQVWIDNHDIGRCGATYLSKRGRFASYGFVTNPNGQFYNLEREVAFRNALQKRGLTSRSYSPTHAIDVDNLIDWMQQLAKPAAIMAADASAARLVLQACSLANLNVPGQIALLSVDRDYALLEENKPSISSVIPNFALMGYLAAKELDRLLSHGNTSEVRETVIPVKTIYEHASTRSATRSYDLIDAAISFVQDNAARTFRPQQVAQHLGVSLRLLELRFKDICHCTVLHKIEEVRLRKVRLMLLKGHSVRTVAQELGFKSIRALSQTVKRHYGITLTQWRKTGMQSDTSPNP